MHDYMMALAIKLITETQFGAYFKKHQNTMKFHQIYDLVRVIKQATFERSRDLVPGDFTGDDRYGCSIDRGVH